jgi:hypothetical protein
MRLCTYRRVTAFSKGSAQAACWQFKLVCSVPRALRRCWHLQAAREEFMAWLEANPLPGTGTAPTSSWPAAPVADPGVRQPCERAAFPAAEALERLEALSNQYPRCVLQRRAGAVSCFCF